jgi:hypothetical protein
MFDYKATPTQIHPDLESRPEQNGTARIQQIREALAHLVIAAGILSEVAEDELRDSVRANREVSGPDRVNLQAIGTSLLTLSAITKKTNTTVKNALELGTPPELPQIHDTTEAPETVELPKEPVALRTHEKPKTPRPHLVEMSARTSAVARVQQTKPARTSPPSSKKEKQPAVRENTRFYSRIIAAEEMPPMEFDGEVEPIDIHIVSDDTITLNGEEIKLKRDQLFLFNAFMMLRNKIDIKASDIRKLGCRWGTTKSDFVLLSQAIGNFRELMQDINGPEDKVLITRRGKNNGTTYQVNPVTITTDIVREGSIVTVNFFDGEDDEQATFRIANSYKESRPDSSAQTLNPSLQLPSLVIGAHVNDIVESKNQAGQLTKLQILAIE